MASQYFITLYDIPSTLDEKSSPSPNLWRTRLLLNYKKLQYATAWVHFSEIESLCKAIGAEPTTTKPDGSPHYTLPVISISSAPGGRPTVISDSVKIAVYLENRFPDPQRPLFPDGTRALQAALRNYIVEKFFFPLYPVVMMPYADILVEPEWFLKTREDVWFKRPLAEVVPLGEARDAVWRTAEKAFDGLASFLDENAGDSSGAAEATVSVVGGRPSYVELELVAFLYMIKKLCFEEGWKRLKDRNEGRWAKLLDRYQEYLIVP